MANEKFRKKIVEFKVIEKKKAQSLNESTQIGDKVIYNGQKEPFNRLWLISFPVWALFYPLS